MSLSIRDGAVALALVLAGGCDVTSLADVRRYAEDFSYDYEMKPGSRLTVENFNGPVEIVGWEQNRIEVRGTKSASTRELLAALRVGVSRTEQTVTVRTLRPEQPARRGSLGVRYRIHVPRQTVLESIESSNGGVQIEDIEGRGKVKTSNGPIKVAQYVGDVDLRTSNGPVELRRYQGAVTIESSNGPVRVEGATGRVEATTSNGPVEVTVAKLQGSQGVRLKTTNGPISITLESQPESDISATTSNGPITVRLAGEPRVRVAASTSNSSITTDFEMGQVEEKSKHRLRATIGGGGPTLNLTTTNGPVRIRRGS